MGDALFIEGGGNLEVIVLEGEASKGVALEGVGNTEVTVLVGINRDTLPVNAAIDAPAPVDLDDHGQAEHKNGEDVEASSDTGLLGGWLQQGVIGAIVQVGHCC